MKRARPFAALVALLVALLVLAVVVMAFLDYQRTPEVVPDDRSLSERVADRVRDAVLDIFT